MNVRPMTVEGLRGLQAPKGTRDDQVAHIRRSEYERRLARLEETRDVYSYVLRFAEPTDAVVLVIRETEQYYRLLLLRPEQEVPDPAGPVYRFDGSTYIRSWAKARLEIERLVGAGAEAAV